MKVLFFGKLADRAGPSLEIDTAGLRTVGEVTDLLCQDVNFRYLLHSATVVTVLDEEVVRPEAPIDGAGELAYLPPVSGG